MKKPTTKLIAVVMFISTVVSSLASESRTTAPAFSTQSPLTAPTVSAKKTVLNLADLAKYKHLAIQSQGLATHQAAGASSTIQAVLFDVGVVVVVVLVVGAPFMA